MLTQPLRLLLHDNNLWERSYISVLIHMQPPPLSLHVLKFTLYFLCYPNSSIAGNNKDLAHVPMIVLPPPNVDSWDEDQPQPPRVETSNLLFGDCVPPVSSKLVKRIEEGKIIEMTEVLYKRLAVYTLNDSHTRASKPKIKHVTNIIDWVQAFGLHVAIISQKQPQRVPELIGYQALIIDAQREYLGECWIGNNHHFRQTVPLQAIEKWIIIDTMEFSLRKRLGLLKQLRYVYVFNTVSTHYSYIHDYTCIV